MVTKGEVYIRFDTPLINYYAIAKQAERTNGNWCPEWYKIKKGG